MRDRRRVGVGAFLLLAAAGPRPASAQGLEYVRASYTKYEHQIPTRDGTKLFTVVYVPKDASATKTYPILLNRTPYGVGPYGSDNYKTTFGPSEAACREGFIFAYQDVRGRYMSEGEFVDVRPYLPVKSSPMNQSAMGAWGDAATSAGWASIVAMAA